MLFSKELLFVHVPKTGGMSIGSHLLAELPRPVFYVRPPHEQAIQDPGVVDIVENRHLPLSAARQLVAQYGFEITDFPMIIAVVRNPYCLEVSRYAYLQNGHAFDAGPDQELALSADFETFAIESSPRGAHFPV